MSYTKQTWQAGDEITSAKLNHLEDGINNVATEVANFPVEVNNPQDGDTLIYNAAEQKWVSGSNNGDSGGVLVVHVSGQDVLELDRTWNEIHNAFISNGVVLSFDDGIELDAVVAVLGSEGAYSVVMFDGSSAMDFFADSPDDYPNHNLTFG